MRNIFPLVALLTLPLAAAEQRKPGEAASLDKVEIQGEAKPGGNLVAIVHVKLEKDWHVQSNKPSEPNFFATVLKLAPTPGVKVTTIKYPEGKAEKVEGLAKPLSVYDGDFQITALLLWPFSFAVTLLLRPRVTAGRLMLWAIGTPTIFYTFLNWDILAVAPMVWGLVEVEKRRWGWAGFAFALGASAKLFPAFVLPGAFLGALAAGDRKGAVRLVSGFGLGALGANVPWMIASFSGWMGVWKFHVNRFPDLGTVWYWLGQAEVEMGGLV